jgi:hypothetical protein
MSAAISYGVSKDLRPDFRALGFPIDDGIWNELMTTVGDYPGDETPNSRLSALSTRARVGAGGQTLISGFAIGGGQKQVLIRAVGPGLAPFGVTGVLSSPVLTLCSGSTVLASNTGWNAATNAADIRNTSAAVGTFPLLEGSADCALLVNLPPGPYTALISSADNSQGVALVEVYEVSGPGQLVGISTRAQALTGSDTLIPGFVVSGNRPKNLLIRCAGPALASFGLTGVIPKPSITLYKGASAIGTNTGWSTAVNSDEITAAARTASDFAFPANSADSALYVNLAPGLYTVLTAGADGQTGIGLVEVYDLDQGGPPAGSSSTADTPGVGAN